MPNDTIRNDFIPNAEGYVVIGSGLGIKRSHKGFDYSVNLLGLQKNELHNVYFSQHENQTRLLYEYLKAFFES